MSRLKELFDKYDDEYLKFDKDKCEVTKRADLAAFIALDRLLPRNDSDIIAAAEHDEIYLGIDTEKLEEVATEEDIKFLVQCGVRYDEEIDSLAMFA